MDKTLKFKPLGNLVVVKRIIKEDVSKGGIVIPEDAQEKPIEGEILAVGPGERNPHTGEKMPLDVNVGDKVIYGKYAGVDFKLQHIDYLFLRETDILGIVEAE